MAGFQMSTEGVAESISSKPCASDTLKWPPNGLVAQAQWILFEPALFILFTMYVAGLATVSASLAERKVGAIHGVILTAWSAAIVGPVTLTELSSRTKASLVPGASRIHIYDQQLQVLVALLAVGFILTILVRPLRRVA
jgi:hypothetical protein